MNTFLKNAPYQQTIVFVKVPHFESLFLKLYEQISVIEKVTIFES